MIEASEQREPVDVALLRRFVPMDALSGTSLERLCKVSMRLRFAAGARPFRVEQPLSQASWLLAGEVRLDGGGGQKADVIRAGSPRAAHRLSGPPLATASAQCLTDVELLAVDGSLLDLLLTWDQSDACEVAGIEDAMTDDWMTRLLQAPAFQRLPPTNLHALFQRLQPVDVKAGERVIRQGDAGDWFYVIVEGRCRIEHQGSHPRALTLAEFGPGDCFGEEALIGGLPRNASAVMLDDGRLMRLARRDFVELLNEPLLLRLGPGAAQARVDAGSALARCAPARRIRGRASPRQPQPAAAPLARESRLAGARAAACLRLRQRTPQRGRGIPADATRLLGSGARQPLSATMRRCQSCAS